MPTSPGMSRTVARIAKRASPSWISSPTRAPSIASSAPSTIAPPSSTSRGHSPAGEVSIAP
jgi:hypothetical protein